MTMLGKSSKCTSRGSSIPLRLTMMRLGCSSTGRDRTNAATCKPPQHTVKTDTPTRRLYHQQRHRHTRKRYSPFAIECKLNALMQVCTDEAADSLTCPGEQTALFATPHGKAETCIRGFAHMQEEFGHMPTKDLSHPPPQQSSIWPTGPDASGQPRHWCE